MTATIPTTARAAAVRARALADVIRSRATIYPAADVLSAMAVFLETAAESYERTPAPVMDGITVTNTTPFEAGAALMKFQALALDHPSAGISDHVAYLVSAPISRRVPELPALNPVSTQMARQETGIRTRIALLTAELDAATDDEGRRTLLDLLVTLYSKFDRLAAAAVAVDNARPCNRR
ncbi:hypothetical protein ACIPQH_25135 [Streptomyces rubiginosohelvolus]|uniref:hypothetical protein n=1 Tax=Streptomyces rubiginosohelvolus TaxID=67362 RepID=UPI0038264004